eukprot:jgi/Mesvir1/8915/Mv14201-RA.1
MKRVSYLDGVASTFSHEGLGSLNDHSGLSYVSCTSLGPKCVKDLRFMPGFFDPSLDPKRMRRMPVRLALLRNKSISAVHIFTGQNTVTLGKGEGVIDHLAFIAMRQQGAQCTCFDALLQSDYRNNMVTVVMCGPQVPLFVDVAARGRAEECGQGCLVSLCFFEWGRLGGCYDEYGMGARLVRASRWQHVRIHA